MNKITASLLLLIASLVVMHHTADGQIRRVSTVSVSADGAEFGQHIRAADIKGDNRNEVFIGAPGFNSNGISSSGAIYLLDTPFSQNRTLESSDIIIRGHLVEQAVGQKFELGKFNGDGETDLAISVPSQQQVILFWGPLDTEDPRNSSDPDLVIQSFNNDIGFANTISVVEDINNDGFDELLVNANQLDGNGTNTGRVFLFNLQQEFTDSSELSENDRSIQFSGTESLAQFGTGLNSARDVNGDGIPDLIIGAHRSDINGDNSGAGYIFFGPFQNDNMEDTDADVVIPGRTEGSFWGSRLLAFDDVNGDGLMEFGFSSTFDEGGKLVMLESRNTWPDTLRITDEFRDDNNATLYELKNDGANFGSSAVFDIDFDLDNGVEPVIGAPANGGGRGSIFQYRLNGQRVRGLRSGNTSQSAMAASMINAGNIFIAPDDSVESTDGLTVLEIEDLVVGAPRDQIQVNGNLVGSGVVHLFSGRLQEPSANLGFIPSNKLNKGDTVTVRATFSEGSFPIKSARLLIDDQERTLDPSTNIFDTTLTRDVQSEIRLNLRVEDELGLLAGVNRRINFAGKPAPFELLNAQRNDTIALEGDAANAIRFEATESSDPDSLNLSYRVLLSVDEVIFENPGHITPGKSEPVFDVQFFDLNNFLIDEAIPLNRPTKVYWSMVVSNGVFQTVASDSSLGSFFLERKGLEPSFELNTVNPIVTIDGLPEQTFSFDWSELSTENPNALVQYRFQLLRDTADSESVIFSQPSVDDGTRTNFDLKFGVLDSVLTNINLREKALNDTVHIGYNVAATVDGQDVVFPENGPLAVAVTINNLVSNPEDEELNEKPDSFELFPNYPNPFNPTTTLKYSLPEPTQVNITIYNILGEAVYEWSSGGRQSAGTHTFNINASSWSSGIYIYQVRTGKNVATGKMSLVK